ncbi:flagellar motor protein MotB [Roseovarius aestuarii]|uniref:Motility protein B n=1 Tax=Roseovarius aestuarii TaxID=475083 RepID=A0A1X7BQH6_9RHOB|nr:flagellar motor protein MotB [Roseovarius aestuarii]SMC11845.1 Motility protein B [Roseovarius aestuarii]
MSAQSNAAPVIIKKKKVVGGDGHHGGAWKVAYADFVTAMMAFFLLMWLLNATTEKQRKGVADYFSPTIPINKVSGGGDGEFGGESVFSENTLQQSGIGASQQHPTEGRQARGEMGVSDDGSDAADKAQEEAALRDIEDALTGRSGESTVSEALRRHIVTRVTDEGLVVELFDLENAQLFETGSDAPTALMSELAVLIGSVGQLIKNEVAVEGHTRSEAITLVTNPVWDLSSARANQMRLLLQASGIPATQMRRVTGHADRELAVTNPMAIRNNRIEVIFLRSDK